MKPEIGKKYFVMKYGEYFYKVDKETNECIGRDWCHKSIITITVVDIIKNRVVFMKDSNTDVWYEFVPSQISRIEYIPCTDETVDIKHEIELLNSKLKTLEQKFQTRKLK